MASRDTLEEKVQVRPLLISCTLSQSLAVAAPTLVAFLHHTTTQPNSRETEFRPIPTDLHFQGGFEQFSGMVQQ